MSDVYTEERRKKFEAACEYLNPDVKPALWKLLEQEYIPNITRCENNIEIVLEERPAFIQKLILQNADDVPIEKRQDEFILQSSIIYKQEEGLFCFYGETDTSETGEFPFFALNFKNADTKVEVYNSSQGYAFWDNPWELLYGATFSIEEKADLSEIYCNEKELEILPIIKEINALINPSCHDANNFSIIRKRLEEYNAEKILKLFSKTDSSKHDSRSFTANISKIVSMLCHKRFEPVWRDIYNQVCDSQKDYPLKTDTAPKQYLEDTRRKISTELKKQGYCGEYPDFYKHIDIKGFHCENSYNMSYFISREKDAISRIYCREDFSDGTLSIQLVSAIGLKSQKLPPYQDIYSCLFNTSGKTFFYQIDYHIYNTYCEPETHADIDMITRIAIKKSEMKKLTKEEQKLYRGNTSLLAPFLFMFVFGGGFFSILLNLGMMLLGIIIFMIAGRFDAIPSMFTDFPWWKLILFSWTAFGGIMGLFTALSSR